MANMTETELRRRLKKLESEPTASTALVSKVGDQYEYDKNFIYIDFKFRIKIFKKSKNTFIIISCQNIV